MCPPPHAHSVFFAIVTVFWLSFEGGTAVVLTASVSDPQTSKQQALIIKETVRPLCSLLGRCGLWQYVKTTL